MLSVPDTTLAEDCASPAFSGRFSSISLLDLGIMGCERERERECENESESEEMNRSVKRGVVDVQ